MTVTILGWNAHANAASQGPRVAAALNQWPDTWQACVLTEVKGARKPLKKWAKRNKCRLIQERAYPMLRADERGDTAILVRRPIKVRRTWTAIMAETWTVFSHEVTHRPRRHRRVVLQLDGWRLRLSAEHWPTRGNRDAWNESYSSARRFLERPGVALVVGDLNADANDVANLADDVQGHVKGVRPDWCVTNRPVPIKVTSLVGGGSDHGALMYEID